jgi:hypothetical protein
MEEPSSGREPSPPNDLDREVSILVRGTGRARLRENFDGDPYMTARCYLGRAITKAMVADPREQAIRERHSGRKALREKVEDQKARLRELLVLHQLDIAHGLVRGGAPLDALSNFDLRDLADDAVNALDRLDKALLKSPDLPPPLREDDKKFEAYFVEEMAYCSVRLTGDAPGPSDQQFAEFVDAAHKTLGTTAPRSLGLPFEVERWELNREAARNVEINIKAFQAHREWKKGIRKPAVNGWVTQIKKTVNRLGADLYQYERDLAPPNIGLQPSPVQRRFFQSDSQNDAETKRLIAQMYSGGEKLRQAAAQLLWNEFELAGRKRRDHYADLGFNVADALALIWPSGPGFYSIPPSGAP